MDRIAHWLIHTKGHRVTVFDQHPYDETGYQPSDSDCRLVASIDHNKIVSNLDQDQESLPLTCD